MANHALSYSKFADSLQENRFRSHSPQTDCYSKINFDKKFNVRKIHKKKRIGKTTYPLF